MKVVDVMTTGIIAVSPNTLVADAARLLLDRRISGMPVVDVAGQLVGIFTEGDLLRRIELGTDRRKPGWFAFLFGSGRLAKEFAHSHGVRVDEAMTRDPLTCAPDDDLSSVVETMIERRIKRLIVVTAGRPIGVVSRADIVRAFLKVADDRARAAVPTGDGKIADRIHAAFREETWVPHRTISLEVHAGTVHLGGTITDPRQREAIRVIVEREAPGAAIVDHMVWIEPFSGAVMDVPE